MLPLPSNISTSPAPTNCAPAQGLPVLHSYSGSSAYPLHMHWETTAMTRLDPAPSQLCPQGWMKGSSVKDNFGRHTGSVVERGREMVAHPLRKSGSSRSLQEDSSLPQFRHTELGRPLPSSHVLEPKASIPFRNPDLGMPSERRGSAVENARMSPTPPKYTMHSNFRRGLPGQHSPRSPSPCRLVPTPFKQAELGASQQWTFDGFYPKPHALSRSSSRVSRSSLQHGSTLSLSSSPSRSPSPFKHNGCPFSNYDTPEPMEEPISPTRSSNGRVLDSEYLHKNLNFIAKSTGSGSSRSYKLSGHKPEMDGASHVHGLDDRSRSRTRRNGEASQQPLSQPHRNASTSNLTPGATPDSMSSPHGSTLSRSSSPPGQSPGPRLVCQSSRSCSVTSDRDGRSRSRGSTGRDLDLRSPSPEYTRSLHQNRSPSPQRRRHTSSQSSIESECSHVSGGLGAEGLNMEGYAVMADLPKPKIIYPIEEIWEKGRRQNRSPLREELYRQSTQNSSHPEWTNCMERGRGKERGRKRQKRHKRGTEEAPCVPSPPLLNTQPDLLNFKKGWMSKLDKDGEWRKHWFVLTDTGLRYYRDAKAEEKDLEGEIDLRSCMGVSEFDVEKNYGFQVKTQEAVFTLSAMTSGIRRNWVEVLRKSILPSSSPDIMQLADGSSDKENSRNCCLQPSSRHICGDSNSEMTSTVSSRPLEHVELSPVTMTTPPTETQLTRSAQVREGHDIEQARRLEDRARWFQAGVPTKEPPPGSSPWDVVLLKKGAVSTTTIQETLERKWVEFERLPLCEMRSLPLIGSHPGQQTSEVLQREVVSLRAQVAQLKVRRDVTKCGPDVLFGQSLEAMEKAHREAMEELQRQHDREVRELEGQRDQLLREEAQATAQAMEALKKALRKELEEEVARARRLSTSPHKTQAPSDTSCVQQDLQRELDSLSERYSQKCVELKHAEECCAQVEQERAQRDREVEQLKKDNEELQSHLTDEISRMRLFITGEGSDGILQSGCERSSCELEVLLRVKENEVHYLQKEISCLRDELHSLNKEKQQACERYKEAYVELSTVKSHSERELESLREHLRLATVALREGECLRNSLPH